MTSLNVIFDVLHAAVYHSELSPHINVVMFCIKLNTWLLKYDENTHVLASETLRRVFKNVSDYAVTEILFFCVCAVSR